MQEELCSSRLLVFINNQVYYRCLENTFNEDAAIGDRLGSHRHGFSLMPFIFAEPDFSSFPTILMYYMRRKLTYPSDILQACRGMLRKLTDIMGVELVEGLPTPLERYLLFSRQPSEDRKELRRRGFPSYSWTGWEYIPEWDEYILESERQLDERKFSGHSVLIARKFAQRTWITWFKRSSDGKLGEINAYKNREPSASKRPETTKEYTVKGVADHFKMVFSTADIPPNLDQLPNLAYEVLFFQTISVFLKLSVVQSSVDSQSRGKYLAYGIEETSFGEISLDADDFDVNAVQELALICEYEDIWDDRVDAGWWGILLRIIGPLAERRGILRIPMEMLNKTLPPGPIWSCIILG